MTTDELKAWRASLRKELIAKRLAISPAQRRDWSAEITRILVQEFPVLNTLSIGIYWPYQGEFDPRFAIRQFRAHGAQAALPEVVQKNAPLQFRAWWPGVAMATGVYDIPVPVGTDLIAPQALLIPPVGFDSEGYRIGYGGGFYDRTLAAAQPRPLTIGVAFEVSRVASIHPQEFDVPMDFVVTERGVFKSPLS
jgi:5-formyltetrahydrofolate cyclo-ligase